MSDKDAPVFIKLEEYNDVLALAAVVRKKLDETRETLLRIRQLMEEEEQELDDWEKNLNDVFDRIDFIDDILKEPRF